MDEIKGGRELNKRELIEQKLKEKGYTIKDVARLLDVSEQTVYNIKNGVTAGDNTILRFVKILEIDVDDWINVS